MYIYSTRSSTSSVFMHALAAAGLVILNWGGGVVSRVGHSFEGGGNFCKMSKKCVKTSIAGSWQ